MTADTTAAASAKPEATPKKASQKTKGSRRSRGLGAAAAGADAASSAALADEEQQKASGYDEAAEMLEAQDEIEESPESDSELTGTTAHKLKTPLMVLSFIAKQICLTHHIKLNHVELGAEDDNDDATVRVSESAPPPPTVSDASAIGDLDSLIAIIRQHEENKHTRVSTALAVFMKNHADLDAKLIPLAHTTFTTASGTIVSACEDAKDIIKLGHAIGKLSGSSEPDKTGQLSAFVVWHCFT